MLLKTSYDTTSGKMVNHTKLEQALKQAISTGVISQRHFNIMPIGDCVAVFVSDMEPEESTIPPFVHPYVLAVKDKTYLVSDIRSFKATTQLYPNEKDFEAAIKNKSEYALVKNRAALELRWIAGQSSMIRAQLSFAGSVFGSWISQSISKVYALDLNDQLHATAIAIYYYHCMFTTEARLEGQALEKAVIHTINATKIPAKEVYGLFEKIPEIRGVEDLCLAISQGLENVRLRDFNLLLLLTQLSGTWYGANAKEMILAAVEYPPAWISLVYAALTEKAYKTSQIYRLVEIQAKRTANVDEFKRNFHDLVDGVMAMESVDNTVVFKDYD